MFSRIPEPEVAEARAALPGASPNSKYWVDFEDFFFYRMDVIDVYYVGGFGVMGWVSASDYYRSQPDPLADSMTDIIQHMNADHKDALILLARHLLTLSRRKQTMTAVDRLGFHVRLKTQDGMRGARIAFLREVSNPRRDSGTLSRNGATGALTGRVNPTSGTQLAHRIAQKPGKTVVFD